MLTESCRRPIHYLLYIITSELPNSDVLLMQIRISPVYIRPSFSKMYSLYGKPSPLQVV